MSLALVRIFTIFVVTILFVGSMIFVLNKMAPNTFPEFEHSLKKSGDLTIEFVRKDSALFDPKTDITWIAGATLQQLSDQSLVLWPTHFINDGEKVRFITSIGPEEWETLAPQSLKFDEFLGKYDESPIFIEINHPTIFDVQAFYEQIKSSRSNDNVMIQTSSQSLKKLMKQREPRWLYGANTSEIGKFKLFSSIFLGSLVDATYDFVVLKKYTNEQLDELNKRHILPLLSRDDFIVTAQPAL